MNIGSAFFLALVSSMVTTLIKAWPAMLLIGVVHHEVSSAVPALGFVHTVLVMAALAWLLPTPTSTSTD